jgi:Na+/proline symporter
MSGVPEVTGSPEFGARLNRLFSGIFSEIRMSDYSKVFDWEWQSDRNFFKQFFAGAFIAIVMTGLDQDMMQKSLTCKNLKDAQKNMYWLSISLVPVNLLFLSLGTLLYAFFIKSGLNFGSEEAFHFSNEAGKYLNTDKLYPELAINHFGIFAGISFLLGIIAAAFSSADSALTSLTTSFIVDILGIDVNKESKSTQKKKQLVHLGFSVLLFLVILVFKWINDDSVINMVFKVAGYTYGPLLGLYAFGLFSRLKVKDRFVPLIGILSPVLTYIVNANSERILYGYQFGFELLLVNGLIMFIGLWLCRTKLPRE